MSGVAPESLIFQKKSTFGPMNNLYLNMITTPTILI